MSNRDKLIHCHFHYLDGSVRCMVDKCGLNGEGCILAETKIVYATPETQVYFGNFRSKEVPAHRECDSFKEDEWGPYPGSVLKHNEYLGKWGKH